MASLRERNRLRARKELQALALDLFEERGFDSVTIEEIAEQGGVSPSTVYRYFGTKEGMVLWEERDAAIVEELTARLAAHPPMQAFQLAVEATLGNEDEALLRRIRFIYDNPAVHAAAIERDLQEQAELAAGFAAAGGRRKPSVEDEAQAAACMAVLDSAIDRWQRKNNRQSLAAILRQSFAALTG